MSTYSYSVIRTYRVRLDYGPNLTEAQFTQKYDVSPLTLTDFATRWADVGDTEGTLYVTTRLDNDSGDDDTAQVLMECELTYGPTEDMCAIKYSVDEVDVT